MIIITAPSGAGKTTIVRHLLNKFDKLAFSVSATSRLPRPSEINGHDYYFYSHDEFKARIENDEFLEYEEVYPNRYYGTLKKELERLWLLDKCVIFDVDVKGALSLMKKYPNDCITIFIKPPSIKTLQERLTNRNTETSDSTTKRLERAAYELSFADAFQHQIVNDDLNIAFQQAEKTIKKYI